jgi:hypothetical protein
MKEYTCGKKFLLISSNHSRHAKSMRKVDFFPKQQSIVAAPKSENSAASIQRVGKNFFLYMSCVM